ncbi:phage regulatory CII family protein, partial [Escherichia coli]|nr:phage regulatory CII family protein [Escherichia coli]
MQCCIQLVPFWDTSGVSTMFDYQVSKHPHFDEACRAFA